MNKRKSIFLFFVSCAGVAAGMTVLTVFNRYLLMSLPLGLRMISMIITYWLIALIPVILMIMNKDKISTLGFYKENAVRQIFVGIIIAAAMSVVLTLIPHLAGFGEYVDNGKRYKYLWQYIFGLFYYIVAVAGAEEFVFRGYLYQKLKEISGNDLTAILCSSAVFGLCHILSGNICQVVVTGCMGVLLCICRRKIRNCSTLSLIIAHGLHDFMITVWSSVL